MNAYIPWWNVELGAEAEGAAARAVRNRNLSMGKLVEEFECRMADELDISHIVAVTNGSAALTLALLEAGIGPGTEVIVPDRTWIATAHAAHMLGAKVVPVDVEDSLPLLNPDSFSRAVTPRTKAVIPVHLNGRGCNMPRIREIAEQHGIAVIEDAAQALFSRSAEGGYLGTHSRCGCFSLSIPKVVTSGQGGFIATHDAKVADRLRRLRTQGTDDVIKAVWVLPGGNFRYTDVLAAIALTQLDKVAERVAALRNVYAFYDSALSDSDSLRFYRYTKKEELPLYSQVLSSDRDDLLHFLAERGIQARAFYPALHTAPYFSLHAKDFENSSQWDKALFLPCGPNRTSAELTETVAAIHSWQKERVLRHDHSQ